MARIELNQKNQMITGSFAPEELQEFLLKSIDDQINFYKLKNLKSWMKNHNCDQDECFNKIHQLQNKRKEIMEVVDEARLLGCEVRLNQSFEISFE